jgi:hypothetical protein
MPARTWGPFNGRQLTTMFCVTIVTLLLPVAAWSASASHVIVDTPVAANVAQRSQFISTGKEKILPGVAAGINGRLLLPPAGKGLVVTTFHAAYSDATANNSSIILFYGNPSNCTGTQYGYVEWSLPSGSGSIDAPMNPGYVVPPGKALCAVSSGGAVVGAAAYGYVVAPGQVPTPPA